MSSNDSEDMDGLQMDHTMSGTSAFDESIFRSNEMLEHDPLFAWDSGYTGDLLTPQDCPELLNTPGTGYTNSPSNMSIPNNFDFNFTTENNDNTSWQAMREFFPQWFPSFGVPDENGEALNKWVSNNQADFTYAGQQELFPSSTYYTNTMQPQQQNQDFTLYNNTISSSNQHTVAPMFPDLDFSGAPFSTATNGVEETIYDDVDADMPVAVKTQDELMLEQYMNFDGEGQAQ